MTKKTRHPQFSIRADKKDWKKFQKISDAEKKIYPVLFHEMLTAYEREQKALKSRDYVAHGSPVNPSQTAQERSHGVEIASEGSGRPKQERGLKMSSIASKLKWEMVCTACGKARSTDDIPEIYGVIPVFCTCGEIMVPEIKREAK